MELLQLLIMALIAKSSRGDNLRMALKIMANRSIIKASWRAPNKIMSLRKEAMANKSMLTIMSQMVLVGTL